MKTDSRQRLLAGIAILGLGLFVSDRLVVSPLVAGVKQRSARIVELKKSISQGSLLLLRADTIRQRWDSMKTNTLPDDVSQAENQVLKAFDSWSRDSKISIAGIKPQWKRTAEDYMTLECRADASGNMEALTQFLYSVEKDSLALRVESVEISARDNEGQQLSLGLQVSGLLLNPQAP